jgi:hypothetical protein
MPEPDGVGLQGGAPEGPLPERRGTRRFAPAGAGERTSVAAWVRAHRGLTVALVVFCVAAVVGAVVSLPRGALLSGRVSRPATGASASRPREESPAADRPASRLPAPADQPSPEPAGAGPWVHETDAPPSERGLTVVYRYRTLPSGAESRYEWIIQLRGARPVLDGVELVTWRMEPAAKNGADFESRDRAADGFPLFGHGPGGWFGVTATVRYQDGAEESLPRRIEFPE